MQTVKSDNRVVQCLVCSTLQTKTPHHFPYCHSTHILLHLCSLQRPSSDSTRGNFCALIMSSSPYEKITAQDLWSLPVVPVSFPCPLESVRSANSQTGPTSVMNQIPNSIIRIFRSFAQYLCGRREVNRIFVNCVLFHRSLRCILHIFLQFFTTEKCDRNDSSRLSHYFLCGTFFM